MDPSPAASGIACWPPDSKCAELLEEKLAGGEYFPLSGTIRFWRDRTLRGKGMIGQEMTMIPVSSAMVERPPSR